MKALRGISILLVGWALAACGDETGPDTTLQLDLDEDLAMVAAEDVAGELGVMQEPGVPGIAFPGVLRFPPVDGQAPDCPRAGDGFRCPPDAHEGLTFEREVTFYALDGSVQEAYDAESTESVEFQAHVYGEIDRPMGTGEVDRSHVLTATGLFGDNSTLTWNGTGSSEMVRSRVLRDGSTALFESSGASTVEDVVVPVPGSEEPWPLSGTITREISLTATGLPSGDRTVERTVVVTFNGTQFVTMQVGDQEYTIDLAAPHHPPAGPHGHGGGPGGGGR